MILLGFLIAIACAFFVIFYLPYVDKKNKK
ncbi:erm Leader peptide [Staphylococcus pasteuri]